ncbi:hypothetical protein AAKU55_005511, partial [Oxalobacteraceae bacterium GrIS 1.11]
VAKRAAADLGIGRQTYYDHIKRFSRAAYVLSQSLKKAQEAMQGHAASDAAHGENGGAQPFRI